MGAGLLCNTGNASSKAAPCTGCSAWNTAAPTASKQLPPPIRRTLRPKPANHSGPRRRMVGDTATVSTLVTAQQTMGTKSYRKQCKQDMGMHTAQAKRGQVSGAGQGGRHVLHFPSLPAGPALHAH